MVCSRRRLPSLLLDGAAEVVVEPLDETAGVQLVRCWLENAEQRQAVELWRFCGGLPLAMRAAGTQVLERPHLSLDDVVRTLGDEAGWLGRGGGHDTVGVVFDQVVAGFSEPARELYRVLGCFPGTSFTAAAVGAAGARGFDAGLGELLTSNLAAPHERSVPSDDAEADALPRRFRLHDVVRAHARAYATAGEPQERGDATSRLFVVFYLNAAGHADRLVLGDRMRLQPPPDGVSPFTSGGQALDWLDAERDNLLAVMRLAHARGWHDAVWRLCESLWALYHSRKHYGDWIEAHRLGVAAAQWEARTDAEIRMRNQLARAYYELGDYDEAHAELDRAQELLGVVADPRLHGVIWETRGLLCRARDDHEAAVGLFTRALRANEGDRHGVAVQSYNVAQALVAAGRPRQALEVLDAALDGAPAGDAMRMRVALVRARAHQAMGHPDQAVTCAVDAAVRAHARKQYAKLDEALALTGALAGDVRDERLRDACLAKTEELRRSMGVAGPDPAAPVAPGGGGS
ncbi:tetratricopeptide repeat protein [Streptantibioticus parmotrematis]|uniref:tetratricopeptide repeat protein n=1 Tax=Streptantibioticus parmotrematis TaxID=2873249 RepID=UPI0027E14794|nr:tetratricopeptide repeat protein [Streptantibioticus parmotrematis]